jgi:hypothetical protein
MTGGHESYRIDWEGFALSVHWCPVWLGESAGYAIAHLEIIADGRTFLPVTPTGYRSHFVQREEVEALGGPVAYARAWLDHAAKSPAWKEQSSASRQLSLLF